MKFMEFICARSRKILRNVRMKVYVYYKCALYHYSENISILLNFILDCKLCNQGQILGLPLSAK